MSEGIDIRIESEIAPLEQVLIHRPGDEVIRMTQHELDLLLFDDILSPSETLREHDLMTQILRDAGAQVIDISDLLEAALRQAPEAAREHLIGRCCELAGARELAPLLAEWPPDRLVHALICGVHWEDFERAPLSLGRIRAQMSRPRAMALRPTPNLMFMRDPCMAVFRHAVMGRMATDARAREPLMVAFAVRHSGRFATPEVLFEQDDGLRHASYRSLEGGDVMVLSPEVLLIGCSQRTRAQTIERLARESLFEACPRLQRVYAVMMPEQRSVMHLDTILTQIDERLFLGHKPLIEGPGDETLAAALLERGKPPRLLEATVLDLLREELGADTRLVACGGDEPLHQQREQWTDGANALTIAPGRIILYARNTYTIGALEELGFDVVQLHWVQPSEHRRALIEAGMRADRAVFSFSGSELSRARGGGRCLTMPLRRGG